MHFKTVYFPKHRTRAKASARVTISVPNSEVDGGYPAGFLAQVRRMGSRELRAALGDPYLEDLEEWATRSTRSLSNTMLWLLKQAFEERGGLDVAGKGANAQPGLFPVIGSTDQVGAVGLTFQESKRLPIHRWYPYVEGFSAHYARDALLRFGPQPRTVYDPFGGAGTTMLAGAILGATTFFSEVNPFMALVAESKVNSVIWARANATTFAHVADEFEKNLLPEILHEVGQGLDLSGYYRAFPNRDFFVEDDLRQLLAAVHLAENASEGSPEARRLLLLACAANAVKSSNMTRRADLRRRRPDEYKKRVVDVPGFIRETLRQIRDDVPTMALGMSPTTRVSADCRSVPQELTNAIDFAITSPPYLNGTNYFRNTKIELWLLGLLETERDLKGLRRSAITAGINNVERSRPISHEFGAVEAVARRLDETAADVRIPALVRHYFSDMRDALGEVFRVLRPGGRFLLDIGDSKFYGVHVPTDDLLVHVASDVGFELEVRNVLARRYSRDRSDLRQVELVFRKPIGAGHAVEARSRPASRRARLDRFRTEVPYKQLPYRKRNWGHKLHSLCSYQGKLKPAIAHWLVREFTAAGDVVVDPLGGVGTVPFEAALQGRESISNDMSKLAATIAHAKLNPPSLDEALAATERIIAEVQQTELDEMDFDSAQFGLNARVADFYHPDTLQEILKARKIFLRRSQWPDPETFVWASLLHILHGNRPYALSRTSHPITPFHPTGPTEYRSLDARIRSRVERALSLPMPGDFVPGKSIQGDFRRLPYEIRGPVDAVITSPPFLGMRFDRPNWLRLWFCGWGQNDFHTKSLGFLERQQTKSADVYREFFEASSRMLGRSGLLIVHIGSGGRGDLVGPLKRLGAERFNLLDEVIEDVQSLERHGIADKGRRTTAHHYLFFEPA